MEKKDFETMRKICSNTVDALFWKASSEQKASGVSHQQQTEIMDIRITGEPLNFDVSEYVSKFAKENDIDPCRISVLGMTKGSVILKIQVNWKDRNPQLANFQVPGYEIIDVARETNRYCYQTYLETICPNDRTLEAEATQNNELPLYRNSLDEVNKIALQNGKQISEDEKQGLIALRMYTTNNVYEEINKGLRMSENDHEQYLIKWKTTIYFMEKGLHYLPVRKQTVYRGIPRKFKFPNQHQNYVLLWTAFSSASLNRNFPQNRASELGTLFIIDSISARHVQIWSKNNWSKSNWIKSFQSFKNN